MAVAGLVGRLRRSANSAGLIERALAGLADPAGGRRPQPARRGRRRRRRRGPVAAGGARCRHHPPALLRARHGAAPVCRQLADRQQPASGRAAGSSTCSAATGPRSDAAIGARRASEADAEAARLLLATNVARNWFALARLLELRRTVLATRDQRRQVLDLVTQRVRSGLDTRVEQHQAEGLFFEVERDLPAIDEQLALLAPCAGGADGAGARGAGRPVAGAGSGCGSRPCRPRCRRTWSAAARISPPRGCASQASLARRRPGAHAVLSQRQPERVRRAQQHRPVAMAAGWQRHRRHRSGAAPADLRCRAAAGRAIGRGTPTSTRPSPATTARWSTRCARSPTSWTRCATCSGSRRSRSRSRRRRNEAAELGEARYRAGLGSFLTVLSAQTNVLAQRRVSIDLKFRSIDRRRRADPRARRRLSRPSRRAPPGRPASHRLPGKTSDDTDPVDPGDARTGDAGAYPAHRQPHRSPPDEGPDDRTTDTPRPRRHLAGAAQSPSRARRSGAGRSSSPSAGIAWGAHWYLVVGRYPRRDRRRLRPEQHRADHAAGRRHGDRGLADDTQFVEAGEPLVRLDPADARVALEQAKSQLAQTVREVRVTSPTTARSPPRSRRARPTSSASAPTSSGPRPNWPGAGRPDAAPLAREDRRRLGRGAAACPDGRRQCPGGGGVGPGGRGGGAAALLGAREQLATNLALTDDTTVENHPNVLRAAARVREAMLAARPGADRRAGRPATSPGASVQIGQRVAPGAPLMAVVPLDQVWVDANFKESQLQRHAHRPAGGAVRRRLRQTRRIPRPDRRPRRRHRRRLRHPAGAERDRQLDQDRAARAGAHRARSRAGDAASAAGRPVDGRPRRYARPERRHGAEPACAGAQPRRRRRRDARRALAPRRRRTPPTAVAAIDRRRPATRPPATMRSDRSTASSARPGSARRGDRSVAAHGERR